MSSILKVDTIQDQSGNNIINESNNVITIGASGDTITVPAGATVSGFTSAGIDDNATSTAITISSAEDVTFTEDIKLADNKIAIFGAGSDLQIFHSATSGNSFIKDVGTGALILGSDGTKILLQKTDGENMGVFNTDGSVDLYHNNAKKFETTATGATVTGNITATGNLTTLGIDDNATSTAITINSSEQVEFTAGTVSLPAITTTGDVNTGIFFPAADTIAFAEGGAEAMRIDSSGNLSIGHTTSGGAKLAICDGANAQIQFFPEISTDTNLIQHYDPTASAYMASDNRASEYLFKIGTAEKMRIDSSGNLLVGTTSTTPATGTSNGNLISSIGRNQFSSNSDTLELNRHGSNGIILSLRKDGTRVGSIGVVNNDNPFFQGNATNHGGLQCGTNTILPVKNSSNSDNTIDLGQSDIRWKDIYLSGGIKLGGTGTANKLDDYEEGTWTPVVNTASGFSTGATNYSGSTAPRYTKIGDRVFLQAQVQMGNSSGNVALDDSITMTGLPFTPADTERNTVTEYRYNTNVAYMTSFLLASGAVQSIVRFLKGTSQRNGGAINININYRV